MRLTPKKLGALTGVPAATIRKWRERYGILKPVRGENGYLYYTSEDYRVLLGVSRQLAAGKKLSDAISLGREVLLNEAPTVAYTASEMQILELLIEGSFEILVKNLDQQLVKRGLPYVIEKEIQPMTILVGKAWESGLITVGTEHAYTRWILGYLLGIALQYKVKERDLRLFVVLPGDEHEVGAMMHYALLAAAGKGGKFCGSMPLDKITEELAQGSYEELHVSATLQPKRQAVTKFVRQIHEKFPRLRIKIGGMGSQMEANRI